MSWAVSQLLEIAHRLAETLAAAADDDTDGEPLIEALRAEGIDAEALMRRLGRSVVEDEALEKSMDARIDTLILRRNRYRTRAEHKRAALSLVMQTVGATKFVDTDFSAFIRPAKGGAVIIAEEDVSKLPEEYQRVTRTANRGAIKEALLSGVVVPYASLSQGGEPHLTIRTK